MDHKRWDDWLALYDQDAVYWAPALVGDEGWTDDPDNDGSLMYMDRAGLEARIFRMGAEIRTPPIRYRILPIVTNVLIHDQADDLTEVSATWMVHSFTRVRSATVRGGLYDYVLQDTPEGLKIFERKFSFTMTGSSDRSISIISDRSDRIQHYRPETTIRAEAPVADVRRMAPAIREHRPLSPATRPVPETFSSSFQPA